MRKTTSTARASKRPKVAGRSTPVLTRDATSTAPAGAEQPEEPPCAADESAEEEPGRFAGIVAVLRRPGVLIPVVLGVVLLAVIGYLGVQVHRHTAADSARTTALESARRYAIDLSTYDYNRLDANFAAVTANARGAFAQQYEQVSAGLTELIKQNQAVSEATVLSSGIVLADENRAVVALFVDQQITNRNNPQPRIDRNRMQMTLVHENGRWLIDGIELL